MNNADRLDGRQPDQTRDRLLLAGLNLLAAKGYRGATTREIARQAGVTEVTMYRHFQSKEDLFAAAVTRFTEELFDLVPQPSGDVEADLLTLAMRFLEHLSSPANRLIRMSPELKEYPKPRKAIQEASHGLRSRFLSLIHHYQKMNEIAEGVDSVVYAAFVSPLIFLDSTVDNEFDCQRYVRFFLNGYRRSHEKGEPTIPPRDLATS